MFSQITGYYFYSSLIQVNAAIFSIYGLFIVFKIQICKSNIDTCKNLIFMRFNILKMISDFEKKNDQQKEEYIAEQARDVANEPIAYQCRQWYENQKSIEKIQDSFKLPLILLITGMIIDAIVLIVMQFIQGIFILELLLYVLSLGLFVWAIRQVYHGITKIITA